MHRPVELHTNRSAPSPMVHTGEAMKGMGFEPKESCMIACKGLCKFLNSQIPSRATGILTPKFEAIADCEGPAKSFGRVVCSANLKK